MSKIDKLLATHLRGLCPIEEDQRQPFLEFLIRSSGQGHMGVVAQEGCIFPPPEEIFEETPPSPDALLLGAKQVEQSLCKTNDPHIVKRGNTYLFKKSADREESIAKSLDYHIAKEPRLHLAKSALSNTLTDEQKNAICSATEAPLFLLTGGPGTGKTYTAAQLIFTLLKHAPYQVLITAPTGKATMHLYKALTKFPEFTTYANQISFGTLHQVLRLSKDPTRQATMAPISADLILVDESSMLDAKLLNLLLKSVCSTSHLILMGDPDQLPPVEAGTLFHTLTEIDWVPKAHLSKCLRCEREEILAFAQAIKEGDLETVRATLEKETEDIHFQKEESLSIERLAKRFTINLDQPIEAIYRILSSLCILSPLREGPYGTNHLNRAIAKALPEGEVPTPLLMTQNAHALEICNGEIGIDLHDGYVYFPSPTGNFRKVHKTLLPPHELGYALSVHKSQGSEYDEVVLCLPQGSERFGREMLYTAVTRTKQKLHILGQQSTLEATLKRSSLCHSSLSPSPCQTA